MQARTTAESGHAGIHRSEDAGTENALPGSDQLRILVNMFIWVCSPKRAGHEPAPVAAARLLLAGGVRG